MGNTNNIKLKGNRALMLLAYTVSMVVLDCYKIAKNPQLDIVSKHDPASAVASMVS